MNKRLKHKIKIMIFLKVFKKNNYLTVRHHSQIFHLKIIQYQNQESLPILFQNNKKINFIQIKLIKNK